MSWRTRFPDSSEAISQIEDEIERERERIRLEEERRKREAELARLAELERQRQEDLALLAAQERAGQFDNIDVPAPPDILQTSNGPGGGFRVRQPGSSHLRQPFAFTPGSTSANNMGDPICCGRFWDRHSNPDYRDGLREHHHHRSRRWMDHPVCPSLAATTCPLTQQVEIGQHHRLCRKHWVVHRSPSPFRGALPRLASRPRPRYISLLIALPSVRFASNVRAWVVLDLELTARLGQWRALVFERKPARYVAAAAASRVVPGAGTGVGPLRLRDIDPPELPGPEWQTIRPRLTGICGSDLATVEGRSSRYFEPLVSFPFVPGHEVVGDRRGGAPIGPRTGPGSGGPRRAPAFPGCRPWRRR